MTALRTAFAWHRPLMTLAAANAVLVPLGLLGMLLDPRVVTSMPVWAKPTKFAISMVIYGLTWAWLYAQTRARSTGRMRRLHAAETLAAVTLGIEQVIIVLQAARGTTSHYWQALRGQSIVAPDVVTAVTFGAILVVTAAAATWALRPTAAAPVVMPVAGAPS